MSDVAALAELRGAGALEAVSIRRSAGCRR
jgi:hypothetical protein